MEKVATRVGGFVAALTAASLAALMAPGPAVGAPRVAAEPGEVAALEAGPPPGSAQGSMMFVLDASGSMVAKLPGGRTRMGAAKTAMNTLIDALPVNIDVGFEVYGTSTGSSPGEKKAGCKDVRVLQPVGRVDRRAMRAQVADLTPRGYTPIGRSLRQAAAALPDSGQRAIVLVSDGIDTCAPPAPCDVARELDGAGVELAVHTVGFQVDPAAREQLRCIADATGGEYHDAPDAKSLADLLPEIAERARRNYVTEGESLSGATSLDKAEYLVPGQYSAHLGKNEPNYFQVAVPEGATGQFSVVHTVELNDKRWDSGVDLRLLDAEKRTCAKSRGFRKFSYDGPETAALTWTAEPNSHCDPAGPHFIEVTWDNLGDSAEDEIEILWSVEPPPLDDPGSPDDEPLAFTEPGTGQDIAWGGGSFNEAATLPGSGRFLDRVRYSEYSIYKVWLDWGQALSYRVTFTDGDEQDRASAVTELRGPTRASLRDHWWKSADYTGSSVALEPVSTPHVRYANRYGEYRPASVAGWYYVVVKLSPVWADGGHVPDTQPTFELALTVSGSATDGPRYGEVNVPSSAPPLPTTRSTWTPQASKAATDAASSSASSGSAFPWWLAGGAVAVALLAVAVVALLRRRTVRR